jgi:hypothetical protein
VACYTRPWVPEPLPWAFIRRQRSGEESVSYDVIGKMGRVTADITPGDLGEVLIEVRQGTERVLASAADPEVTIKKHTQVLVVGSLGGRTVEVAPTDTVRLPR